MLHGELLVFCETRPVNISRHVFVWFVVCRWNPSHVPPIPRYRVVSLTKSFITFATMFEYVGSLGKWLVWDVVSCAFGILGTRSRKFVADTSHNTKNFGLSSAFVSSVLGVALLSYFYVSPSCLSLFCVALLCAALLCLISGEDQVRNQTRPI